MRRAPVSIVILAWNAWEETQACLESLRPTLGVSDQVIVVDNGSSDRTAVRLRAYPWVHVLTNVENRGFAAGCNQGAEAAEHETIVFLNNDTILAGRWIDALVAPFGDTRVGATGPRSNYVSGPQLVEEVPYPPGDRAALRAFTRSWAASHLGERSLVSRLVGFCMAVRSSAFRALGGFDEGYEIGGFEDDDLCHRLVEAGWLLVIVHESFVHHTGHKTFAANDVDWYAQQKVNQQRFERKFRDVATKPVSLLSASLIVRDESEWIVDCLAALAPVADEIVVYDTGSTDDTVALARAHGAKVVAGEWHGDFASARNAALAHCSGDWVVTLDADELVVCADPAGLRDLLARGTTTANAYEVIVEHAASPRPVGEPEPGALRNRDVRLFRREAGRFDGTLLERLTSTSAHRQLSVAPLDALSVLNLGHVEFLEHTGAVTDAGNDRARRTSRVDRFEAGFSATILAALLLDAGRAEDALAFSRRALETPAEAPIRATALRVRAAALIALGRAHEALGVVSQLRPLPGAAREAGLLEIDALERDGQHERALESLDELESLDQLEPPPWGDGWTAQAHLHERRAVLLGSLGRWSEAADLLLSLAARRDRSPGWLGAVISALDHCGRPIVEIAHAVPRDHLAELFGSVGRAGAEANNRLLEACYSELPGERLPVLAAAQLLAREMPVESAIAWSSRLRAEGLAAACPLVSIAANPDHSALERARASIALYKLFGDTGGAMSFPVAFAVASPEERAAIAADVASVAPELLTGAWSTNQPATSETAGNGTAVTRVPPSPPLAPVLAAAPGGRQVSIVIPCWNKAEYTLRCLQSLQAHTTPGSYQLVIVDNGSADGTASLTSSSDDDSFVVVRNRENLGFARACNQGAAAASADTLVFLNNDTEVLPGWLPPLIASLDDPAVGIAGARLLFPDGTLQHAGIEVGDIYHDGLFDGTHRFYRLPGTHPEALEREPVRAVTGAALAIRRRAFDEVGGFDEGYWNGNEDVDLCLKVGEKSWAVMYEPASCIIHHESVSGSERFAQVTENRRRLTERWGPAARAPHEAEHRDVASEPPDRTPGARRANAHAASAAGGPRVLVAGRSPATTSGLVSIVIPTYNRRDYLEEALLSAVSQTHADLEIIVCDNASTDGTIDMAMALAREDRRITILQQPRNMGPTVNGVSAVRAARGEFLKWLMSDDRLEPNAVARLVEPMLSDPLVTLATSVRTRIAADGSKLPPIGATAPLLDHDAVLPGVQLGDAALRCNLNVIGEPSTVLVRRAMVDPELSTSLGGRSYRFVGDLAVWLHLLSLGSAAYLVEPLSQFRSHPGQDQLTQNRCRGLAEWWNLTRWAIAHGFLKERSSRVEALTRLSSSLLEASSAAPSHLDRFGADRVMSEIAATIAGDTDAPTPGRLGASAANPDVAVLGSSPVARSLSEDLGRMLAPRWTVGLAQDDSTGGLGIVVVPRIERGAAGDEGLRSGRRTICEAIERIACAPTVGAAVGRSAGETLFFAARSSALLDAGLGITASGLTDGGAVLEAIRAAGWEVVELACPPAASIQPGASGPPPPALVEV